MKWWLMALAFLLGAVLTWIAIVRTTTREVRIVEERPVRGRGGRQAAAALGTAGAGAATVYTGKSMDAEVVAPIAAPAVPEAEGSSLSGDVDDFDLPETGLPGMNVAAPAAAAAAVVALDAPGVDLDAPAVDLDAAAPVVDLDAPAVDLDAPAVDLDAPAVDLDVAAPAVDLDAPAVDLDAPAVDLDAPVVDLDAAAPVVDLDAPAVDLDAPAMDLDAAVPVGGGAAGLVALAATDSPEPETSREPEPGDFGPGSANSGPDGGGPVGWDIKGNADSMLYHSPESPWFTQTKAEVWFRDEAGAVASGFARWDSRSRGSSEPVAFVDVEPEPGDYGPGSANPGAQGRGPVGWDIKGNADSMLFHTPESPWYKRTKAEVWFKDEDTAKAAGFAHWDHERR